MGNGFRKFFPDSRKSESGPMLNVQQRAGLRRPQELLRKLLRNSTAIIGRRRVSVPMASPRLGQGVPSTSGCRTHAIGDTTAYVYHRCGGATLNVPEQFSVDSWSPYQVHRSMLVHHSCPAHGVLIGLPNHWPCAVQNAVRRMKDNPVVQTSCLDQAHFETSSGVNHKVPLVNIAAIRRLPGAFSQCEQDILADKSAPPFALAE